VFPDTIDCVKFVDAFWNIVHCDENAKHPADVERNREVFLKDNEFETNASNYLLDKIIYPKYDPIR